MDHGEGSSSLASTEHLQVHKQVAEVGVWGSKAKGTEANHWSFRFNNNHKLKKIAIDHGDLIYSLMYTTEDGRGCLHDSKKAGGWNGGCKVTKVKKTSNKLTHNCHDSKKADGWNGGCKVTKITFDCDEEITGISGTVGVSTGVYAGYTIISSLSFRTNKRTHGPFGKATGTHFSVPWSKGSFAGFYGRFGYYIDAIGVYLKASKEPARVGLWGTKSSTDPEHHWSFVLEKNIRLTTITIDHHGSIIYSLMFTTVDSTGFVHVSYKAGGHHDGSTISKVHLSRDEYIIGIHGTIRASTAANVARTISSLSFVTNIRNHGHFGHATGTHFSVPWSKGSFAGFYGIGSHHIDGIGVYLKATA